MADTPLLKDLVDRDSVGAIAAAIGGATTSFDEGGFVGAVFDDGWGGRELKQRIRHIARMIRNHLPGDYATALAVLRRAAGQLALGGISAWCLNDFVEEYGVDDPDVSLPALEQFTKIASAEFAVRPFIDRYPERMANQMREWAGNDDEAVRRLASEGFRPRLPWGMGLPALKKDPSPILPVLEVLHNDPSETVRRSVANSLNDISKDHPELVVTTLARWGADTPDGAILRKHALRTLLKRGDPAALELLGFRTDAAVTVSGISVQPGTVAIGGHVLVEFQVVATGDSPQPVMVDYAVEFQNRSGTGSRKVFKGKADELAAGDSLTFRRKVSLQHMSTRTIFPGTHVVEAQVNGLVRAVAHFEVVQ